MLKLRSTRQVFSRGNIRFIDSNNQHILAFVREWQDDQALIVHNLSNCTQPVHLLLGAHIDCYLEQIFGDNHFPVITAQPYFMSLSPYSSLWFNITKNVDS